MKSFAEYTALTEDRPRKFTPEDVDYHDADSLGQRCARCFHFYIRSRDCFGVCEIMRSDDTDETGVDPDYVCSFFTIDGVEFPIRKAR